jgi:hypothetical protein
VGFANERAFVLFVSSAFLTCATMVMWFVARLVLDRRVHVHRCLLYLLAKGSIRLRVRDALPGEFALLGLGVLLALLVAIGTGCLLYGQLHSILENSTFIEECVLDELEYRDGRRRRSPYDLGWRANVRQLIGSSLLRFFVPLGARTDLASGTDFPVREHCSKGLANRWRAMAKHSANDDTIDDGIVDDESTPPASTKEQSSLRKRRRQSRRRRATSDDSSDDGSSSDYE